MAARGLYAAAALYALAAVAGGWPGASAGWTQGEHVRMLASGLQSDAFMLALPALSALPCAGELVRELQSGFARLALPRAGFERYALRATRRAMLAPALALLLGLLVALILGALMMSPLERAVADYRSELGGLIARVLTLSLLAGLYGLLGSLAALAGRSQAMGLAAPFVAQYLLMTLSERFLSGNYFFNPREWISPASYWPGGRLGVIALLAALALLLFAAHAALAERRLADA